MKIDNDKNVVALSIMNVDAELVDASVAKPTAQIASPAAAKCDKWSIALANYNHSLE